MDRQSNDQAKMDRTSNNDLQNITQKTKDRSTGTPLKTGHDLRCYGMVYISLFLIVLSREIKKRDIVAIASPLPRPANNKNVANTICSLSDTQMSFTNITEILLKVALHIIILTICTIRIKYTSQVAIRIKCKYII
jgi:hypothetical protein